MVKTLKSYQHSHPGEPHLLQVDDGCAGVVEEDGPLHQPTSWSQAEDRRHRRKLAIVTALVGGILFVGAFGGFGSHTSRQPALRSSSDNVELLGSTHVDYDQADWEGKGSKQHQEGQYDWQKCKDSDDPDCWKNEGERVGNFWHNFGQKQKAFWTNFGHRIRNIFKKNTEPEPAEEPTNGPEPIETPSQEPTEEPEPTEKPKKKKHAKEQQELPAEEPAET